MALIVASYTDPTDPRPEAAIANAYAWAYRTDLYWGLNGYALTLWVHRTEGAANLFPPPPPIETLVIEPGSVLKPAVPEVPANPEADPPVAAVPEVPAVVAPTLLEFYGLCQAALDAEPALGIQGAQKKVLYDLAAQHHKLSPCTIV